MGFSLLEAMLALLLLALLLSQAWPSYRQPLRRIRLAEARVALMENANFLEDWYQRQGRYQDEARWPPLPHPATPHYRLEFEARPHGHPHGKYRLYARARDGDATYLVLDEYGALRQCEPHDGRLRCEGF
ncbi:type IV pilin protein [Paludibacterium yongneupense]|uniref:type IV pilin protein n=1 Tax=Paludibacterium yongneupense TaxID=400061 RepID=UPI000418046C|nr:type IV pilin protein [Paludibacterium yongneupense]